MKAPAANVQLVAAGRRASSKIASTTQIVDKFTESTSARPTRVAISSVSIRGFRPCTWHTTWPAATMVLAHDRSLLCCGRAVAIRALRYGSCLSAAGRPGVGDRSGLSREGDTGWRGSLQARCPGGDVRRLAFVLNLA